MTFNGQMICPLRLCGSRRTGYATALMSQYGELQLAKWTLDSEIAFTPLQWPYYQVRLGLAFQGMVGGRFILGGRTHFDTPVLVSEFDESGNAVAGFKFGDKSNFDGAWAELNNGGLAGVIFCNTTPENFIRFDAFYRNPCPPYPGGHGACWWSQRYQFPSNTGSPLPYFSTAVEADGMLWIFFTRDSAGHIGLTRFRIEPDRLVLVEHEAAFIPRDQGDLSVSGEYPPIFAAYDRWNNRIVLAYQAFRDRHTTCPNRQIASVFSLTEVLPDLRANLLGTTGWWSSHVDKALPVIVPRPDGIHFALDYQNIDPDCAVGWNLGLHADGKFHVIETWPEGKILAASRDGMVAFYDKSANTTDFIKRRFRPEMKFRTEGKDAIITWDEDSAGDILESNADGNWRAVHTGRPPVRRPINPKLRTEVFQVRVQ